MNTYFETPKFTQKWSAVILTAGLILFTIFPALGFPKSAEGAPCTGSNTYFINEGSHGLSGNTFSMNGTSNVANQTGANNNQHMSVDWDTDQDHSPQTGTSQWQEAPAGDLVFSPIPDGCGFTATWSGSHIYTSGGSYTVRVMVHHGSSTGHDGSASLDTLVFNIIVPTMGGLVVTKNVVTGSAIPNNFSFTIDAGSPIDFESGGSNEFTLTQGTYSIAEIADVHYTSDLSLCGSNGLVTVTASATTTCEIKNTFTNNAPAVQDLNIVTNEDTPISDVLLGSDIDLDSILYAILTSPISGLLPGFNSGTGDFTYTPDLNFNGSDSFTYKASDAYSSSVTGTVSITVNSVNDAPVANGDADSTDEDVPLTTIDVLANDTDVDGDALSVSAVDSTSVGGGTVVDNGDGTFDYTPAPDFSGPDTFNYTVSDGNGGTDTAVVTIMVSSTNDAPVADDDSYSTDEDTLLTVSAPGVLDNDSDTENDPLTAVLDTDVSNGTLALNSDGSFDYTPDSDFNGTDSFTYKANDGNADSGVVTVTIDVDDVNDAPVAVGQSISTTQNISLPGVLGATDVDGDSLTYATTTDPVNGLITFFDSATGAFTYTPNTGFSGSDSFDFKANDSLLDSNIATVSITVSSSPACSDSVDNDGDNLADYPNDPGCADANDNDETDPVTPPSTPSSGGGGGGSGGNTSCSNSRDDDGDGLADTLDPGCHSDGNASNPSSYVPSDNNEGEGSVLGVSTIGQVLGESCGLYLSKFIRSGRANNVEQVQKLQTFLNKWMNASLPVTGFYGPMTLAAVKNFQAKYATEILAPWNITAPTGIVYQTTLRQINMLECPELSLTLPPLIEWSRNPNTQS